ncbi:MAG TPA: DUF1810 domain-containing protein [Propionibacteriaceae bacterium]|nr:DUF1810 domain-containing protein [Propionibacteriaceae bacterium]
MAEAGEDPFDLARFVQAQESGDTYAHAVDELRRGRKESHWMWFVFPQIAGLGRSATARLYALASLEEARAYAAHALLGERLVECSTLVAQKSDRSAQQIFGSIDALKLRSSMTLFFRAAPEQPVFRRVIETFFDGLDPATEEQLALRSQSP